MIAVCLKDPVFWEEACFDEKLAARYPGAGAWPLVRALAESQERQVVTGDTALRLLRQDAIPAQQIQVFQEQDSEIGLELLKMGARGKFLFSLESPMFARGFYRQMRRLSNQFDHVMVFRGLQDQIAPTAVAHDMYFPTIDGAIHNQTYPGAARSRGMVMIANKKYWRPRRTDLRGVIGALLPRARYPRYLPSIKKAQLHDYRHSFIAAFATRKLDIVGEGWNPTDFVSSTPQSLSQSCQFLSPRSYAEKHAILASYTFAVCIENAGIPGYVTEKVIDALNSGCIPIYLGAPDIEQFVSKDAFIDLRSFESLHEARDYLDGLTYPDILAFQQAGIEFLASSAGKKFTFQSFAARILSLAE